MLPSNTHSWMNNHNANRSLWRALVSAAGSGEHYPVANIIHTMANDYHARFDTFLPVAKPHIKAICLASQGKLGSHTKCLEHLTGLWIPEMQAFRLFDFNWEDLRAWARTTLATNNAASYNVLHEVARILYPENFVQPSQAA